MTKREEKVIKYLKWANRNTDFNKTEFVWVHDFLNEALDNLEKKAKGESRIRNYAQWHIDTITEEIKDYIDDDKVGNKHIIGELKEEREHWRDIIRILDNKTDELYMKFLKRELDDVEEGD